MAYVKLGSRNRPNVLMFGGESWIILAGFDASGWSVAIKAKSSREWKRNISSLIQLSARKLLV